MIASFKKIACQHIVFFDKNRFVKYIPHDPKPHEIEMRGRSEMVPIGYIAEDESTTKGTISILETLERTTPLVHGQKTPVLAFGDGLTCMRVQSAKLIRAGSVGNNNFNNVYTTHGDWHRRLTLLKNLVNTFTFSLESKQSIGSFAHIRDVLGFRNASTDVSSSFNYVYDLAEACMHGLATLLLMELLQIESQDEIPQGCPDLEDEDACSKFFHDICTQAALVCSASGVGTNFICECSDSEKPLICRNNLCQRVFHQKCNNSFITEGTNGLGGPYCSLACSDRIFNYTRCLLHSVMSQVQRHDAIRVNDAELMHIQMKQDMQTFVTMGNHHYVKILGTYLLSQAGCAPPQIVHDMRWNRTVNKIGESNRNLEADLACEHVVRDTKKQIGIVGGINRLSALTRRLQVKETHAMIRQDTAYKVGGRSAYTSKHKIDLRGYVRTLVIRLQKSRLFSARESRSHPGLEDFKYCMQPVSKTDYEKAIRNVVEEFAENEELLYNYPLNLDRGENELFVCGVQGRSWNLVTSTTFPLDDMLTTLSQRFPYLPRPNDVQFEVAKSISQGSDVIAILPTGFGKTVIVAFASAYKYVQKQSRSPSVVVIVSPLLLLIDEQVKRFNSWGIKSFKFSADSSVEVSNTIQMASEGQSETSENLFVLLCTPEFLGTDLGRTALFDLQLFLIVVDEAHLVTEWGQDFRPAYSKLGNVRECFTGNLCAMTATCSQQTLEAINVQLNFHEPKVFASLPNTPNIFLEQLPIRNRNKFLVGLCDGIRKHGVNFPRTLVFVDSYADLIVVKKKVIGELKGQAFIGPKNENRKCLIGTFCSELDEETKNFMAAEFSAGEGVVRILIATIGYGIGIDNKEIRMVVHWKEQTNMQKYCQEIGRAGRDGKPALAVSFSQTKVSNCLRENMLKPFDLPEQSMLQLQYALDYATACEGNCEECK